MNDYITICILCNFLIGRVAGNDGYYRYQITHTLTTAVFWLDGDLNYTDGNIRPLPNFLREVRAAINKSNH